jgi:hypothetical protein
MMLDLDLPLYIRGMHVSEVLATLVPVGQFLGALSAIAAIATFCWSNVRLSARRLGIVDLAPKQIAFWIKP